jgi:hypothetical protein
VLVELLTVDVEHEEVPGGCSRLFEPNLSVLARSLRARKNKATIVSLEMLDQETSKAA